MAMPTPIIHVPSQLAPIVTSPIIATEPVEVKCEEAAYNYLLTQFEPALGKLNPQAPVKMIASELLALHERLSK